MTGYIFDIKRYATHDGPGIRTTTFLSGCPLRCAWCHNPEGLGLPAENTGREASPPVLRGVERGFTGKVTVDQVRDELVRDRVFYESSGGGVTFSGGEPLMQADFLAALLTACKAEELHTAVDTSGCAPWETIDAIREQVDLFLFDIKLIDDEQHVARTGCSNRAILANLVKLSRSGAHVTARFPVVPGITATDKNVEDVLRFLTGETGVRTISLLPYHAFAAAKYKRLDLPFALEGVPPPTETELAQLSKVFESNGFTVSTGG